MSSPAAQLTAQHLKSKFTQYDADSLHRAVLAYGEGINHFGGEQVTALVDDSDKGTFTLGMIFTDRRVIHRYNKDYHSIPYAAMSAPVKVGSSMVTNRFVEVTVNGETTRMVIWNSKPVGAVLEGLLALSPAQRAPQPEPLLRPSEDDPTGAKNAANGVTDRRMKILMGIVAARATLGEIDVSAGRALAGKATLLQRTIDYGRGGREGMFISTLPPDHLRAVFAALFGDPQATEGDRALFRLGGRGKQAAKAAASSAVGAAAAALTGFGWVSTPGKSISEVVVTVKDLTHVSGWLLDAKSGSKTVPAASIFQDGLGPTFAQGVSRALFAVEARMLLAEALGTVDEAAQQAQANRLFGQPIDLSVF